MSFNAAPRTPGPPLPCQNGTRPSASGGSAGLPPQERLTAFALAWTSTSDSLGGSHSVSLCATAPTPPTSPPDVPPAPPGLRDQAATLTAGTFRLCLQVWAFGLHLPWVLRGRGATEHGTAGPRDMGRGCVSTPPTFASGRLAAAAGLLLRSAWVYHAVLWYRASASVRRPEGFPPE